MENCFKENSIHFVKIAPSYIKQPKYYIVCCICNNELNSTSLEDLVETANNSGWRYVYELDVIVCSKLKCFDAIKNMTEGNLCSGESL